jgi:ABC-type dipeptide/oligopeptide/nickel transport system permease component
MPKYIIGRCLQAIVVLAGVTTAVFLILNLTGDPAALLLPESATQQDYVEIRKQLGLDRPLLVQYARYMERAVAFDFGFSYRQQQPAISLVMDRMPATIELAVTAFLIALCIALPTGIISATKRDSSVDFGVRFIALLGQSMPNFWLGMMLILLVALGLDLLPTSGRLSTGIESTAFTSFYLFEGLLTLNGRLFWDAVQHVILPGVTAGLYSSSRLTRMIRSSMIDVLGEDYVRTARAKGLSEWVVIGRHALKNAAIPVVTMAGIELGLLLGGTVVTETVFAWPGAGLLTVQALQNDDFPVIQAAVFFLAFIFVFINLAVDLLYAWLDPRIRYD